MVRCELGAHLLENRKGLMVTVDWDHTIILLLFIFIHVLTPRTTQARSPAYSGPEVSHDEVITAGGGWCDYFFITPVSSQFSSRLG